jgi:acetoin:2,6-dichlorophenolindophenol oxidoreductase subunit beta
VPQLSYRDAVIQALDEEMARDPEVFLLGQDVGRMGGNFATTRGLFGKYGPDRVRDTAISEDAIVGAAIGASVCGLRPVAEIMFSSFLGCCWDELINHASQLHYVSNGTISPRLTIRTVNVLGRSAGCHHSGRPEAALMHIPGLAIVAPADPRDVKGLLKASIRSDNPVVFIEHALLYGERCELDPAAPELVELGRARTLRSGSDLTILSYSGGVRIAAAAALVLQNGGISAEVLDLRTLAPLDVDGIVGSVARTMRAIVVEEDVRTCGVGAEIIALLCELIGGDLDRPPVRVAAADVPVPFSPVLEEAIVPTVLKVVTAARRLVGQAP